MILRNFLTNLSKFLKILTIFLSFFLISPIILRPSTLARFRNTYEYEVVRSIIVYRKTKSFTKKS